MMMMMNSDIRSVTDVTKATNATSAIGVKEPYSSTLMVEVELYIDPMKTSLPVRSVSVNTGV